MLPDYYSILGVPPSADLATIRQAYRKKASACHPDHGGSHAAMTQINEAWTVLSNPETRARYDESRQSRPSAAAPPFSQEDVAQARRQAQDYPQDWNKFEDWLDVVAADFSHARYKKVSGPWLTSWPTVHESLSGWLFIVGGGGVGFLLGLALVVSRFSAKQGGSNGIAMLMGCTLLACGGAWVGRWLHQVVGEIMKPTLAPSQPRPKATHEESLIIRCPQCSQQLKLPKVPQVLTVTCKKCKNRFELPPSVG
jgi:hypothetical protein